MCLGESTSRASTAKRQVGDADGMDLRAIEQHGCGSLLQIPQRDFRWCKRITICNFVQLTFGKVGADRPRMAEIRALGALARFLRRQGKNRTFREPQ
jgi:hypothetical protein